MEKFTYTIDQIRETGNYQKLCDMFLSLAKNDEIKTKLESILYKGYFNNYYISSSIGSKDNPRIEANRRIGMAYLLLRNPETFEMLMQNNVNLFHGTNANVLPSILKYGVNSVDESVKMGIEVTTGEKWSRFGGKRSFVSFTDVLDIAQGYASSNAKIDKDQLSFEVIIGTSVEDAIQVGTDRIGSDIPEVGIRNKLPKENIKVICVPTEKVEFVKKIVDNLEIKVLPMDDMDSKFYYCDTDFNYHFSINEQKFEEFKKSLTNKNKTKKEFSNSEVESLTHGRFLKNMLEQMKKLQSVIVGGENLEHRKTNK